MCDELAQQDRLAGSRQPVGRIRGLWNPSEAVGRLEVYVRGGANCSVVQDT